MAVGWETRPAMVLRKNTLGKSSFSLLQELPHTEEAEAGSQRNSKIKERSGGKNPRNYLLSLPRWEEGRKGVKIREDPNCLNISVQVGDFWSNSYKD